MYTCISMCSTAFYKYTFIQGFVGVLDTQAAVYVWDQCFLQLWENKVLEDMCLCLLMLLRYKFMAAKDYSDMKKVGVQ